MDWTPKTRHKNKTSLVQYTIWEMSLIILEFPGDWSPNFGSSPTLRPSIDLRRCLSFSLILGVTEKLSVPGEGRSVFVLRPQVVLQGRAPATTLFGINKKTDAFRIQTSVCIIDHRGVLITCPVYWVHSIKTPGAFSFKPIHSTSFPLSSIYCRLWCLK